MQRQKLIYAELYSHDIGTLDIYVGIIIPLDNPINLFVNMGQLENSTSKLIYIFAYSIGRKRIMFWGVFNRSNQQLSIDGECKYSPYQLNGIYHNWTNNNYTYVGNFVQNKIRDFFTEKPLDTFEEYRRKKYILSYFNKETSQEQISYRLGSSIIPNFYQQVNTIYSVTKNDPNYSNYITKLLRIYRQDVIRYELSPNIIPSNTKQNTLNLIITKFYDHIKYGQHTSDHHYKLLSQCPNIQECTNVKNYLKNCEVFFYGMDDPLYHNPEDGRFLL